MGLYREEEYLIMAEAELARRKQQSQFFVVTDKKDRVYLFDNHAAALKCRQDLKLNHWFLFGVGINSDWVDGEPVRKKD